MNIRKEKLDLYRAVYEALKPRLREILTEEQAIILDLYLGKNKSFTEITEQLNFTDLHIVKEELKNIAIRISALA